MGSGLEVAPPKGRRGAEGGVSMVQESRDKAGRRSHRDPLWPRPGCLGRKDKLPGWTPPCRALGRRAGLGVVVLPEQWGLSRPLPGPRTKPERSMPSGTRAGCGAEPEAWPSVTSPLPSTPLSQPAQGEGGMRSHRPGSAVGADGVLGEQGPDGNLPGRL